MSIYILIQLIDLCAGLLTILVVIHAILSWFMPPYHPVRAAIDRLVEPMLTPIRRFVPLAGMFDFSPLIFILLVQFISQVLIGFLRSL